MKTAEDKRQGELASYRDTIESIWVAIILAFVLRAFVVEAFVIPTGSMAPRLLGEHWDIQCETCGWQFAYGGSKAQGEMAAFSRSLPSSPAGARCPNCQQEPNQESYLNNGDRVLVLKYLYHFAEPQPWDVVVFKNPQDNRQNYIKRLIGLPGETLEIVHGNVFVRSDPNGPWHVRRKPAKAQDVMWQVIYDNDFHPDPLWVHASRGPQCPRWEDKLNSGLWDANGEGGRVFAFRGGGAAGELTFVAERDRFLPHYGYNDYGRESGALNRSIDVCTDLRLSCVVAAREGAGSLGLEMACLGDRYQAVVHYDGQVTISFRNDAGGWEVKGAIPALQAGQGYEAALTHADYRTMLWINGEVVLDGNDPQHRPSDYVWTKNLIGHAGNFHELPQPELKISAAGALCAVSHVKVQRDVYYTAGNLQFDPRDPACKYAVSINNVCGDPNFGKLVNMPAFRERYRRSEVGAAGWGSMDKPIHLAKRDDNPDLDEFFVMGDNSPQSLDGRCWTEAAPSLRLYDANGNFQYQLGTVPRYNMIGKGMFVYWPAGFRVPFMPSLPLIPNVGRMRLIR